MKTKLVVQALGPLALVVGCHAPDLSHRAPEHSIPAPSSTSPSTTPESTSMDQEFESVSVSIGQEYLTREAALRAAGHAALPTLRAHETDANPSARLLSRVLTTWITDNPPDYEAALTYLLEGAERMAGRTPMGTPRADVVADHLDHKHGDSVVELLALRLLHAEAWPRWRVLGVILYLRKHATPKLTDVLIAIAATVDAETLPFVLETIEAAADPDLAAKLDAAELRSRATSTEWPAPLYELRSRSPWR